MRLGGGTEVIPPSQHLPMQKLRELKTRSIFFRRWKTGRKERPMVGRRTRHRARASIMKPMLMWMRTGGRAGRGLSQSHPQTLSKVNPQTDPY